MKKNNKKFIIVSIFFLILCLVGAISYFLLTAKKEDALTLEESKWIDSNKHNVIDIALLNDIPVLSYEGEGLVYNYLDYITEKHSLKFNVVSYKIDNTTEYNYKMNITDKPTNDDIVLLEDNMIMVTNDNHEFSDIKDIRNLTLGVLASDIDKFKESFKDQNVTLISYNNYTELKNAFTEAKANYNENATASINGILILKSLFTKEIIENDYTISYHFNDINKYIVLNVNKRDVLSGIFNKTYNSWKESEYYKEYNSFLLSSYYKFKNISDVEQKKLNSKNYIYGFIDYGIYNNLKNNKINGLTQILLKDFSNFSNLSIKYTKYNSFSRLLKDFNKDKVDFVLNIADTKLYPKDIYKTVGVFKNNLAIISGVNNYYSIDSINSLKGKTVLVIKDSNLSKYLNDIGIETKAYNNMKDLTKDFKVTDIAIVDLENYNFYKTSAFKDSKIDYILDRNNYNFVIKDTKDNKLFADLFNFYSSFTSTNKLISLNYDKASYQNVNIIYILLIIICLLLIYLIIDFSNHIKALIKIMRKNKKTHLSKADKIKYIDQLTSLKNRAYLNSKIESWDDSEVYPQSIIIIDLNNVSYINDNYGREEGDKVITEAANILIQHQMQNSEIIRTDGNEFLIYLVGYSEKQIIAYLRKLNKELKGISHGFGASSGYSVITDAIKTVDDAVNEATLEMKNNKEDIDY